MNALSRTNCPSPLEGEGREGGSLAAHGVPPLWHDVAAARSAIAQHTDRRRDPAVVTPASQAARWLPLSATAADRTLRRRLFLCLSKARHRSRWWPACDQRNARRGTDEVARRARLSCRAVLEQRGAGKHQWRGLGHPEGIAELTPLPNPPP